jgi:sterol desaturase/sphingolipid hydroxylase (fatty acid hydroxylase superfamily)
MEPFVTTDEILIRLGFFFGIFALVAVSEVLAPRRRLTTNKGARWLANLGLVLLNTVVLRLVLPAAAVGMALYASEQGFGLLNEMALPYWLAFVIALLVLDLTMYLQHVMVHAVPLLWRLHRVHHADLDVDVTTGARFHPIEVVVSMLIKMSVIALIGAPAAAVIVFEVLLNGLAMFNHGNINIPAAVDRILRWFVVTPDMHRVHHSIEQDEANTNFGFNLSLWDRVFATYRAQPRGGHAGMTLGITGYREPSQADRLWGMLAMPFIGRVQEYAINRRAG